MLDSYAYSSASPIGYADPLGLSPADVAAIQNFAQAWTNGQTAQGWRIDPGWRNDTCFYSRLLRIPDPRCRKDHDYAGCKDQANDLLHSLNAAIANGTLPLDDQWNFNLNGNLFHYWVGAQSSNPSDPQLGLDPFNNQFGPGLNQLPYGFGLQ
jgi:hypothetical protein